LSSRFTQFEISQNICFVGVACYYCTYYFLLWVRRADVCTKALPRHPINFGPDHLFLRLLMKYRALHLMVEEEGQQSILYLFLYTSFVFLVTETVVNQHQQQKKKNKKKKHDVVEDGGSRELQVSKAVQETIQKRKYPIYRQETSLPLTLPMEYSKLLSATMNENSVALFSNLLHHICTPDAKVIKRVYGKRNAKTGKVKNVFHDADTVRYNSIGEFFDYTKTYYSMVPDGVFQDRSVRSCDSKYGTMILVTFKYYGTLVNYLLTGCCSLQEYQAWCY